MKQRIIILFIIAITVGCSSEHGLEGTEPVGIQAYIGNSSIRTRVGVVDNIWEIDDNIAVKISGDVKNYKIANARGDMIGLSTSECHYWPSDPTSIAVSAWYFGRGYNTTSTPFTVDQDQTSLAKLKNQLYLYAPQKTINYTDGIKTLTFYHQLCYVEIAVPRKMYIKEVHIGNSSTMRSGAFSEPVSPNKYGTWSTPGTPVNGYVNACLLEHRGANDIYVGFMIPQSVNTGQYMFTMVANDNSEYAYICTTNESFGAGDKIVFEIETNADTGFVTVTKWSEQGESTPGGVGNIQAIEWQKLQ